MTITFRQMEVFRAVAQEKSFSRASHKLLVSQSTVSEHIRQLEESLKTKVLQRDRRNVALTPMGENLLEYAHKVFRLLDEAELSAKTTHDPFSGKLSFACASTTLLYQLPPVLMEYARKYPQVDLNIVTDTIEGVALRVFSGSVDFALAVLPITGPELKKVVLVEEPFVAVLPARHKLAKRAALPIKDLIQEPFILYRQGTNTRKAIDRFLHKKRMAIRVVMELDHTEAIKEMVANGFGVSLLPASAFVTHKRPKELKTFPLEARELKRTLALVHLRSKSLRPTAHALWELLRKHFSAQNAQKL